MLKEARCSLGWEHHFHSSVLLIASRAAYPSYDMAVRITAPIGPGSRALRVEFIGGTTAGIVTASRILGVVTRRKLLRQSFHRGVAQRQLPAKCFARTVREKNRNALVTSAESYDFVRYRG